jgi:hypothetical protein
MDEFGVGFVLAPDHVILLVAVGLLKGENSGVQR